MHFLLHLNSLLLDNERWKQADVPAEFQDLVDSIADGKITLPEKKSGGMCILFTFLSQFEIVHSLICSNSLFNSVIWKDSFLADI